MKQKIQKIEDWYMNDWLVDVFEEALTENDKFFFSEIYMPFRNVEAITEDGQTTYVLSDTWEYENMGWSKDEVTNAYWAIYGGNYFPEYYANDTDFDAAMTAHKCRVERLIESVFKLNYPKYRKMIELAGFAYDPLNNVDAHELHAEFENHGGESGVQSNANSSATANHSKNEHKVSAYDSTVKTEYTDEVNGQGTTTQPSLPIPGTSSATVDGTSVTSPSNVYSGVATNQYESQHTEATNASGDFGTGRTQHAYHVDAKNNAFGQELWGADYFKATKDRRYGNIGVTKTQELLDAERENLRYNLLKEFFRDINEVILIGIFDN